MSPFNNCKKTVSVEKATNLNPSGATGFGVRLLNKLIEENYE